jgi:putative DNA primase/helicase
VPHDSDTARFLQAIFPDYEKHAIFASEHNDIAESWKQFRKLESLDLTCDCYLSHAAYPNDGKTTRRGRAIEARALVIDDVGTKVPAADVLRVLGPVTCEVLTSEGNAQWWYRLKQPVPRCDWKGFFLEVERLVGCALDGEEIGHVFRLPMGVNTKPVRSGFKPRLGRSNPEVRLDAAEILLFAPAGPAGVQVSKGHAEPVPDIVAFARILPNPEEAWNDRHAWVCRAHQFKARAPDEVAAWEAFKLWSEKHSSHDPAKLEKLWDSIGTPNTLGFELLADVEKADPTAYAAIMGTHEKAKAVFDDNPEPPDPFAGSQAVEFFVDQERSSIEVVKHFAGRLRCVGRGDWREFDEGTGRWREWTGEHMLRRVLELVRERKGRALDPEVAKKLASVKFIEGIARAAALHVSVIAKTTDFDRAPLLLGVPSGVIELRPGASRAVRRGRASEMVSKAMWVDPAPAGTPCPEWTRFLTEFTRQDPSLVEWLQVRAGYCLTGLMDEYIMPFYHGSGGNGKSVYLNALRSVWGEYGAQIEHRLLFEKTGGYHLAPLAVLAGVRLAIVTDVPQAASWDVHIMKMLTGDDAITANRMHQNPITFKSTAKVDVSGNGEPVVKDMDEGVRRRLKLIPLTAQPKVIDKQLSRKLLNEYGAILSWALAGLDKYWALGGLPASSTVDEATREYHNMLDPFQRWLDTAVAEDRSSGAKVFGIDLFRSWDAFRSGEGRHSVNPINVSALVRKMKDKDFDFSTLDGRACLRGYKLNKNDPFNVF